MEWTGDQLIARIEANVAQAVRESALAVAERARQRASIPVSRAGKKFIRSKAGEDPRREFGNYVKSIGVDHKSGALQALVGSPTDVAGFLNLGTSRMGKRPNFKKALDDSTPAIRDRINNAVRRSLT